MTSREMLILAALGSACAAPGSTGEPPAPSPPVVELPSGASITLPVRGPTEHEADGSRESFRSREGIVWSVQTLEGAGDASLEEMAIALCRRVELGEVEGELTHRACTFAGQQAQCIEGWQTGRSGERVLRRGAILHAGADVVWVSLAMRDGAGALGPLAESLATETRVDAAR